MFFGLAVIAGLAGTGIAASQRQSSADLYGELKPVVVTSKALAPDRVITPKIARRRLSVVRIPSRFAPAEAVVEPSHVVGFKPAAQLPAGTYLSAALLRTPEPEQDSPSSMRGLDPGLQPVEIQVAGASPASLSATVGRVDVIVTADARHGSGGRTYLAANQVPLLDLRTGRDDSGPGGSVAVLGLTRRQALHLIKAETYARSIRLLPAGGN